MGAAIGGVTDVVIGRKLWDEWSEYWQSAGADDPFAPVHQPGAQTRRVLDALR